MPRTWEQQRGQAKWFAKGMMVSLEKLSRSPLPFSAAEKKRFKKAATELRRTMDRWDKTSREERRFNALRHQE